MKENLNNGLQYAGNDKAVESIRKRTRVQRYCVELLTNDQVLAWLDFSKRAAAESGSITTATFTPLDHSDYTEESVEKKRTRLACAAGSSKSWERIWVAKSDGGRIVGSLELGGYGTTAERHRALLAVSIESGHRSFGLKPGALYELIRSSLMWARNLESIDWIDVEVFAGNEPSLRLCRKFGFVEVGRVPDKYRIKGKSIDGVLLTRRIPTEK